MQPGVCCGEDCYIDVCQHHPPIRSVSIPMRSNKHTRQLVKFNEFHADKARNNARRNRIEAEIYVDQDNNVIPEVRLCEHKNAVVRMTA